MMKFLSSLLVLFCSGCAGIVIPLDSSPLTSANKLQFEFVDLRADQEKLFKHAKEGQPYHYYGDKEFVPPRLEVLRDALIMHFGQKLVGHRIEISRFDFIAYVPGLIKRQENVGKSAAFFGLVGGVAAAVSDKPDMGDKFICSLEASVDGKQIVVTDSETIPGYIDLSPAKEAGNRLIQRIIQTFVTKVEPELK